jgi:radical SAM superfamily enzyme YgiQ (UPF0313 family)
MRVLILATNQERRPMPTMPIGAAHVAGAVRHQGHEVELLDLFWEEDPIAVARERIKSFAPDLIGISMRNVDDTDMVLNVTYLEPNKRMVDAVREITDAPIVMGGAGFSLFADELVRYMDVPYGVAGEGELAFPALLACLEARREPDDIPGVFFRRNGQVVGNRPQFIPDIDALPQPAYDLLTPQPYFEEAGAMAIEGRRGCNLHCIYCPEKGPAGFRLRRIDKVVDQIELLVKEYGVTNFSFTDGVVNYPYQYGMEMFQAIIDRQLQITWSAMINPIGINKEMVDLMKASGCNFLSVGLDAASEKMLESYHKDFTKEDVARLAHLLNDAGLMSVTTLMFGGPGETTDTIQESLDFLMSLPLSVVYMCLGVRIYAGTELADIATEEGFVQEGESLMMPKFYLSRAVDPNIADKLTQICESKMMWATSALTAH